MDGVWPICTNGRGVMSELCQLQVERMLGINPLSGDLKTTSLKSHTGKYLIFRRSKLHDLRCL